jgi:SAM-dependent methyltransferase
VNRPDVDAIVSELRARVDERRKAGAYPPGLEDDLAAHFRRIAQYRAPEPNIDQVKRALEELGRHLEISTARISLESGVPGGERLHRALAKAQSRQIEGVVHQIREFVDACYAAVAALTQAVQDPYSHVHVELVTQIDAVVERLTALERSPEPGEPELQRRLEQLERAEARRRFRPTFSWSRFHDAFPPPAPSTGLLGRLEGRGPVLAVGCGRGDFLTALAARGIEGRGIEADAELATLARAAGHDVEEADPVVALAAVADGSLGAVAFIRSLERFEPQEIDQLIALAGDKVRPGGAVACEAVDPAAESTIVSPVPLRAVAPEYLTFLLREAGFVDIEQLPREPLAYVVVASR